MKHKVMVFAPSPQLTVTIENLGGTADLHVHPGGQGIWQARTVASLGVPVVLCAGLGGETGAVLRQLIEQEDVELVAVPVRARNGGYVHDRRGGERVEVAESPGDPISRHDFDSLYERALLEGLDAETVVLSGPAQENTVPDEAYRRLAGDLRVNGCRVLADLSGAQLDAALQGGLDFVKVSHEELLDDGRAAANEPGELIKAMRTLRREGAESVLVSRSDRPALALLAGAQGEGESGEDGVVEIEVPPLNPADSRGAGDSMTAAVAAALTQGMSLVDAVRLGAAAGALNVTRFGLGTSDGAGAREFAERVELRPYRQRR